jgi:hypothetical protein
MSIDDRITQLVERHEALAESVEMLLAAVKADAENIRGLARVAEIHERRLTRLEGGEPNGR